MRSHVSKLVSWHHLNFVEDEKPPVDLSNLLHLVFFLSSALAGKTDHVVRAYNDTCFVFFNIGYGFLDVNVTTGEPCMFAH